MDAELLTIVFAGVAAAAMAFGFAAYWLERRGPTINARLKSVLSTNDQSSEREWLRTATLQERLEEALQAFGRVAAAVRKFFAIYDQADIPISLPRFLGLVVALGLTGGMGLTAYLDDVRVLPVGITVAGGLPIVWMLWRRKRRLRQFSAQLANVLDLIARATRSGQSFHTALRAVTEELLPPASTEFRRVYDAIGLGASTEDALEAMLLRVPLEDLRFFVTAVVIQKQTGGNLAEVLDKIGACVRERFRIEGQVQALTGEGRMSGVVLMALPICTFFAMLIFNPEYIDPLFNDPVGQRLLQVSLILQGIGAVVIQQTVKIDV